MITLMGLVLASPMALADAFKWVDKDGVHYSDKGQPGAEVIRLPTAQGGRRGPTAAGPATKADKRAASPSAPARYTKFRIVQPTDGGTVRSNEGKVQVVLDLEPDLAPKHRFRFYLDGEALKGDFASRLVVFENVERGEHSLRVEIVDAGNGRVIQTRSIKFFLRRAAETHPDRTGSDSQSSKGFAPRYPPVEQGQFRPVPAGDYRPAFTPRYTPDSKPHSQPQQ